MNSNWQKDYPLLSDLSEANLDDNSSLKKMLQLVGDNKRVVDFGCATGYFAKLLTNRGCQVTGVEVNSKAAKLAEQYCEQVIVADLDFVSLSEILPKQGFDVAVFGDVLEHLRDPWRVLRETREILKPKGYVVASIPNIAHGAIRLALLQGRFEYMELGILDRTHLRFFTRKSVEILFDESEFFVDSVERTKLSIFSGSNWIPELKQDTFESKIVQEIEQDEDADTLQFVVKAFPSTIEGKYAVLSNQYSSLVEEVKSSHSQLNQIKVELEQLQIELQEKTGQLECSQFQIQQKQSELELSKVEIQQKQIYLNESQFQLEQTQAELEQTQAELQKAQVELQENQAEVRQIQCQIQQTQTEWQETQTKLQQAHQGWESCQNIIKAMESSKFWKLRQAWFRLKRSLGLKAY
ncbi:methyltransferase domain-containing protein [Aetokthonos hydrillicola Thurmond2011]|jgi:2-polyprenyl-3-methyl-5-hydroxy-6-metoxy-1,4-benzoquinol methylase|uniref:Methyltransferase domain-containing protein n=1 Tax=Aetokthonos hydrillicola Thurmond2011 TaxID=2712845 RepID=A0AAP5M9K8_9CYAN|nr:class I SAM-dependent methyltransferase [Aetokthonos hydrillicola]MBO3463324.1 methyltransferase domain-containing protein [Aetokthonos hydrillicola CCALA 1050]MBW4586793.1 methyltransferase domain-containing protein [Aetokthonos hydrillicola CCALA 1050]MDR9895847.1 methyltransferase domain-containing protein [Aetokthonos hydrillicola Thurmond2011]